MNREFRNFTITAVLLVVLFAAMCILVVELKVIQSQKTLEDQKKAYKFEQAKQRKTVS